MKLKILALTVALAAMMTFSLFYFLGSAGADTQGNVAPSVNVDTTLSLALEGGSNVQWGTKPAGTAHTAAIQAVVSANTGWKLSVRRTSDIGTDYGLEGVTYPEYVIPSLNFTFTSAAGSPAPSGTPVITPTEFPHAENTDVWTNGVADDGSKVAITYSLSIPADQYPQGYSATHTYTLTATP